jgi:hypothetical protein
VTNPAGLFENLQARHMDNVVLFLGKIGKTWTAASGLRFEAGRKLFLPASPFSAPHFRYYEKGGGIDHKTGKAYGGIILARTLTAYIRGTY